MKVIGYRKFTYKSKKTGADVKAVNLYVTEKGNPDKGFMGETCERLFCFEDSLNGYLPMIGDNVEILYNKYGNISSVIPKK